MTDAAFGKGGLSSGAHLVLLLGVLRSWQSHEQVSPASFDHFVSAVEQRKRNGEAKLLRRSKIDDELDFR